MGLKKILKKVGKGLKKAAPVIIAGLGAAALAKNKRLRATDSPGNKLALAKKLMTSNKAYTGGGYDDPITKGGSGVKENPDTNWYQKIKDAPWPRMAEGGRATYKSGGAALRGVSPILMKGKK